MNNIYEVRKTCIFYVLSPKLVLKFCKHLVLKFHFLLLGTLFFSQPYYCIHDHTIGMVVII